MNKSTYKTLVQKWLLLPSLAILCFVFTLVFKHKPELAEKYYAQIIYPALAKVLSSFSSVLPFSLSDIYYLLLIATPLILILLLIFKKINFSRAGKLSLNIIATNYLLFYLLWGFNYYRPDVNQRLNLLDQESSKEEFIQVFKQLIEHTNTLHCTFDSTNKKEIDRFIEDSYQTLAPALQLKYPVGSRLDKGITFSGFFAKTGITGYFGPFFNEVHVNKKALAIDYPFVLAHEKAHQFGITSEAEANFYAWMVCNYSNSKLLQYSANLSMLHHFIIQARSLDEYSKLIKQISPEVKKDFNARLAYWHRLRNKKMDKAASKANDLYLKSNNVKKGIADYNGVVQHIMNFSLDSAFQERHNLATR